DGRRPVSFSVDGTDWFTTTKALRFSEDGTKLWSTSIDGVHQWDAATGKILVEPKFSGKARLQVVSPDGKFVVRCWSNYQSGRIELIDAVTGKEIFPAELTSCTSFVVSPDS